MSKELSCSFCGRDRSEVSVLIQAEEALICGACVVICVELLINESNSRQREPGDLKVAKLAELEREEGKGEGDG